MKVMKDELKSMAWAVFAGIIKMVAVAIWPLWLLFLVMLLAYLYYDFLTL